MQLALGLVTVSDTDSLEVWSSYCTLAFEKLWTQAHLVHSASETNCLQNMCQHVCSSSWQRMLA